MYREPITILNETPSPASKKGPRVARLIGFLCLGVAVAVASISLKFRDGSAARTAEGADPVILAAPVSVVQPETTPLPVPDTVLALTVSSGDTIMSLLSGAGASSEEARAAIHALSQKFSPRHIQPGQDVLVRLADDPNTGLPRLQQLKLAATPIRDVIVLRDGTGGFRAKTHDKLVARRMVRAEGVIDSSLYQAALDAGVPLRILGNMIDIFSFDVDFQREVRRGDRFALMFEELRDENGDLVDYGAVQIAAMTLRGEERRYYRFRDGEGFTDYFDSQGRSARKALLKTPVDGARLSSGFGKRKHPILGYTKMHLGLDFAASRGTPIYAAGDGVVEAAGRNGGYGNYIRIRHNGTYKTAYAHMHRLARGIRAGKRVRQRQVIGYVGSTGRSTGPHLHYEVHKNNRKVNPLGVKLPTGKVLKGKLLASFKRARQEFDIQYAALSPSNGRPQTVAQNKVGSMTAVR